MYKELFAPKLALFAQIFIAPVGSFCLEFLHFELVKLIIVLREKFGDLRSVAEAAGRIEGLIKGDVSPRFRSRMLGGGQRIRLPQVFREN